MQKRSRVYLLISLCVLCLTGFRVRAQESTFKVPEGLVQQLIKDINRNDRNFRLSDHDLDVLRKNLKCELQDVNGDGVLEFFLYIDHPDWCGAGTNCDYWVYQRRLAKYRLLLNDKQLRAKRTRTNGYRDLVSETPMGVLAPGKYRFYNTLYKYDGKRYRPVSSGLQIKTRKGKLSS